MKHTDKTRDVRATSKGMTCGVDCPSCEEAFELSVNVAPVAPEKVAEMEKAAADLVLRTAELQARTADLTRTQGDLTARTTELSRTAAELEQVRLEKAAAGARVATLETDLGTARTEVLESRIATAKRDLDVLVAADKVPPTEVPIEMGLLRHYLSKTERTADGKLVGETEWAERLTMLGQRASRGLLGPPIVDADPNRAGVRPLPAPTPTPRRSTDTVGGQALAALIVEQVAEPKPALAVR